MVKYSNAGFCITLFGSNTMPTVVNSSGEVSLGNFTLDSTNTIDLYVRIAAFKPEDEGETKTSISDYQLLINKFRKGYNIELMPLNVNTDKTYYTNLFKILKSFEYKFIFSDTHRADNFGAKFFDYQFIENSSYCLPINITDYNPELDEEKGLMKISFTCKAKFL